MGVNYELRGFHDRLFNRAEFRGFNYCVPVFFREAGREHDIQNYPGEPSLSGFVNAELHLLG